MLPPLPPQAPPITLCLPSLALAFLPSLALLIAADTTRGHRPPAGGEGGEAAGSHGRWQRPALPDVFTCEIKFSTTAILATLKGKEEETQGPYRRRIILNAVVVRVLIDDRIYGWCLFFLSRSCSLVKFISCFSCSCVYGFGSNEHCSGCKVLDECALMNVLNIVLDVTMWRGSWGVDRFWIRLDELFNFVVDNFFS